MPYPTVPSRSPYNFPFPQNNVSGLVIKWANSVLAVVVGIQHYKWRANLLLDVPDPVARWSRLRCSQVSPAVLAHLLHSHAAGVADGSSTTTCHAASYVHTNDSSTGWHSPLLQLPAGQGWYAVSAQSATAQGYCRDCGKLCSSEKGVVANL